MEFLTPSSWKIEQALFFRKKIEVVVWKMIPLSNTATMNLDSISETDQNSKLSNFHNLVNF